ncbi:hypothetical protein [Paenibacillus apis]|uniref:Uncharacterized protein n=1 Tax=Paenibacillus apis TaxID=1792174 RepID=A0A919XZX4_9BACL|nr:hypothetical protein [Paenibacillus apis]GIO40778.1 hypothetical protein J41TS4_05360 [Paenibacillus apis]
MCSRIGGQAASVPDEKSEKQLPGHIRTTQPIAASHYVPLGWWDVVNMETLAATFVKYIFKKEEAGSNMY